MSSDKKLIDLFYESENRSIKWKKYFPVYENLFNSYKNKNITFVEIGILDGGSLEIWKKYFGKNSRIIGIDNNPICKKFENKNFEVFIGSQSDPNFWKNFYQKVGNVDIVLDDGGHTNDQQIVSLVESIKNINDGGLFVVEDIHTSYQKHYGNPYKYSFINLSKKIIDDVNFNFPDMPKFKCSFNKFIYSIQFFESIVSFSINRKLCNENYQIENEGYKSNNLDTTLDQNFFKFRNKYSFMYNFKLIKKIERFIIKLFYKKKSFNLRNYFK